MSNNNEEGKPKRDEGMLIDERKLVEYIRKLLNEDKDAKLEDSEG